MRTFLPWRRLFGGIGIFVGLLVAGCDKAPPANNSETKSAAASTPAPVILTRTPVTSTRTPVTSTRTPVNSTPAPARAAAVTEPPITVPGATVPPEPWIGLPPARWPQMVLTNNADFRGHTPLEGASSFLIRTADGRVMAATARHLIGANGGVEPDVPAEKLMAVLNLWRMYPRTKPHLAATITGLGYKTPPSQNLDWLILKVKSEGSTWPSTPLALSSRPVAVGDDVFLVGVPYVERDRVQNVYRGKVTARGFGDRFRYTIDPPVDIRGFSGAPILDTRGHVVGVMTIWFEPKMQGTQYLEAGGEDAASVVGTILPAR